MVIRRPLHTQALGLILTTAARRYKARRAPARPVRADMAVLDEICPRWLRVVVDSDGG